MTTKERLKLITTIATKQPGIGKTALMKVIYLLQTIFDVPFGYSFDIYTYGPYCKAVMSDIEYAEFIGYISVSSVDYPNGLSGYQINAKSSELISTADVVDKYHEAMDATISFFGGKSAKELELLSTIVFVCKSYESMNKEIQKAEICKVVHSIKPHFSLETIELNFDILLDGHFI